VEASLKERGQGSNARLSKRDWEGGGLPLRQGGGVRRSAAGSSRCGI